ncbi:MAG TPA: BON domain-containing protein [Rhodocyclaceae bacterium]|nr:BON domain-containing protein [Rhodocyclaceae bacterium]
MTYRKMTALALALGSTLVLGASINAYAADNSTPRSDSGPATSDTRDNSSGSVGQYVDDATITTRVKTRFAKDATVNGSRIKVETNKGVVELSGTVASNTEKAQATTLAEGVPDVKSVRNKLIVKGSTGQGTQPAPARSVPSNPPQ